MLPAQVTKNKVLWWIKLTIPFYTSHKNLWRYGSNMQERQPDCLTCIYITLQGPSPGRLDSAGYLIIETLMTEQSYVNSNFELILSKIE